MSTNYADEDYDTDEVDESEASESPRGLRRAANKGKKLESENQQLKRELAFFKAGIDTDDPRMKYFAKGYEGELTADAVRQAAMDAGFIQTQSAAQNAQNQEIASAQQRVLTASAGAIYEDSSEDAAFSRLEQAMEEGGVDAMMEVARQYGIPIATEQ
jgi:ribosomal protein L12E/L44/L45/RPP1/RPP2